MFKIPTACVIHTISFTNGKSQRTTTYSPSATNNNEMRFLGKLGVLVVFEVRKIRLHDGKVFRSSPFRVKREGRNRYTFDVLSK